MATALAVSRLLLALQYIAVLGYAIGRRASRVYLPLGLCIAALIVSLGIFAGFTQEFEPGPEARMSVLDKTKNVFYAVVGFEAIVVLGVAMIWRTLSFKKTHIVERMGLLTLIVIGEGAIGVTKTVTKLMGKHGLQVSYLRHYLLILANHTQDNGLFHLARVLRFDFLHHIDSVLPLGHLLRQSTRTPLRNDPPANLLHPTLSSALVYRGRC